MAFSFGGGAAATPAAAPTFGAAPAAPAMPSFGSAAPAAPAATASFGGGGGAFGAAPAAAAGTAAPTTAFGAAAPAPTTTGFGVGGGGGGGFGSSFGATPAAAAAAPTTGFGVGASATTGFFGGAAPATAPTGGGLFGTATATTTATTPSFFGGGQQPQQQQLTTMQPLLQHVISGNTPYSDLTPQYKQAIDNLYRAMMNHKRIMINMESMAPQQLLVSSASASSSTSVAADVAGAGLGYNSSTTSSSPPLKHQISQLQNQLNSLLQDVADLQHDSQVAKTQWEDLTRQAYMYGVWPVEAVGVRRGVRLTPTPAIADENRDTANTTTATNPSSSTAGSSSSSTTTSSSTAKSAEYVQTKLREILDRQMAYVDRVERLPSPYLWQVVEEMERRLRRLHEHARTIQHQVEKARDANNANDGSNEIHVTDVVETQHQDLCRVTSQITYLHSAMERLRCAYRLYEDDGEANVIDKANAETARQERWIEEQIQMQYIQAYHSGPGAGAAAAAGQQQQQAQGAPGFGVGTPAPGTSAFSFSGAPATPGTSPAATPAPTTGFGFGTAAAPTGFGAAPSTAGFGATPAPGGAAPAAPLFGAPAATTATPGFGAPVGATATGGFGFSSTASTTSGSSSSSKGKKKSSSGRLRR